jgi:hypothetical protein
MRHVKWFNFPAFDAARDKLKAEGWEVISPADMDRETGFDATKLPEDYDWGRIPDNFDLKACIDRDVAAVLKADAIYLLDGWETSMGTRAEKSVAEWAMKRIMYQTPPMHTGEVISTDAITGAKKATKLARFDLIPVRPLWELATHYGKGALKYAERNFEAGYKWSFSYAAAMRHLNQFWSGEDIDEETGSKHVIAAAWHCFCLALFMLTHPEKDDRPNKPK